MSFYLHVLQNAQSRDELALCWKVFAKWSQIWPDRQWQDVQDAFKERARQLGLEWTK